MGRAVWVKPGLAGHSPHKATTVAHLDATIVLTCPNRVPEATAQTVQEHLGAGSDEGCHFTSCSATQGRGQCASACLCSVPLSSWSRGRSPGFPTVPSFPAHLPARSSLWWCVSDKAEEQSAASPLPSRREAGGDALAAQAFPRGWGALPPPSPPREAQVGGGLGNPRQGASP